MRASILNCSFITVLKGKNVEYLAKLGRAFFYTSSALWQTIIILSHLLIIKTFFIIILWLSSVNIVSLFYQYVLQLYSPIILTILVHLYSPTIMTLFLYYFNYSSMTILINLWLFGNNLTLFWEMQNIYI